MKAPLLSAEQFIIPLENPNPSSFIAYAPLRVEAIELERLLIPHCVRNCANGIWRPRIPAVFTTSNAQNLKQ